MEDKLIHQIKTKGVAVIPNPALANRVYEELKGSIKGLILLNRATSSTIVTPGKYTYVLKGLIKEGKFLQDKLEDITEGLKVFNELIKSGGKTEAAKENYTIGPICGECKNPIWVKSKDPEQLEGQTVIPDAGMEVCSCSAKPCQTC